MNSRNVTINFLDTSNKAGTLKISYISTTATNAQILEFTQGLINLTDNSYVSTYKNDIEKLD